MVASPVQVWVPHLYVGPLDEAYNRDLLCARKEWRGEGRVWLLPYAKDITHWMLERQGLPRRRECIVPSETFNMISVVHVDDARRTYPWLGSRPSDRVMGVVPPGFYTQWLNVLPDVHEAPKWVEMQVPTVSDSTVRYQNWEVKAGPEGGVPLRILDLELYQDLEAHLTIRSCSRCGQVIRGGHRDRQYCTREENADCVKGGARERQRRHRSRP